MTLSRAPFAQGLTESPLSDLEDPFVRRPLARYEGEEEAAAKG